MSEIENDLNAKFQIDYNNNNQNPNEGNNFPIMNPNSENYTVSQNIYDANAPLVQNTNINEQQPINNFNQNQDNLNVNLNFNPPQNNTNDLNTNPQYNNNNQQIITNNQAPNIINNDTKINFPQPFSNLENKEPMVAPQFNNIQQPVSINQNSIGVYNQPNFNQPYFNQPYTNRPNYQVHLPQQYNNIEEQPRNSNSNPWVICCVSTALCCFCCCCFLPMLIGLSLSSQYK